jgi:hypothetical protein
MADYDHLINALQQAAAESNASDSSSVYRVFGPGGYSWLEIADVLENLRNEVTVLQEDIDAASHTPSSAEPEYEYSYSYDSAFGAGRILAQYDSWYPTMERAEQERAGDTRFDRIAPTFLVARTKAGEMFKLNPKDGTDG